MAEVLFASVMCLEVLVKKPCFRQPFVDSYVVHAPDVISCYISKVLS